MIYPCGDQSTGLIINSQDIVGHGEVSFGTYSYGEENDMREDMIGNALVCIVSKLMNLLFQKRKALEHEFDVWFQVSLTVLLHAGVLM